MDALEQIFELMESPDDPDVREQIAAIAAFTSNALGRMPGYVGVPEAAKKLGISRVRVMDYLRDGRLGAAIPAQPWRIPLDAVESFKPNPKGRRKLSTEEGEKCRS